MEAPRDSCVIAARVAMDQPEAMGSPAFDIGVKRFDGAMLLREGWGTKQVLKALLWLRRENLNRGHIYVRAAGVHGLTLVDDLKPDALARMKAEGFAPAAVVETSPGNLQAWLKQRRNARRGGQHAGGQAAGRPFRRRPGKRRLAPLRAAGRVHQSQTEPAARFRLAAVCAIGGGAWPSLS
jgi:hypothetical protein